MVKFPAPVGGTPSHTDFVPSIIFSVMYGCIVPMNVYRLWHRRSRTVLLIGTIIFSLERNVLFALRAAYTHDDKSNVPNGIFDYMQTTFALGSIGIANDLVNIVRCLLVNPTYGPERFPESAAASTKGNKMALPVEGVAQDMPRHRFWIRRFCDFWGLAFLASNIPASVANSHFHRAFGSQFEADKIFKLRIASSSVCMFLTAGLLSMVYWGMSRLDRISRRGVRVVGALVCLVNIITIYRLVVMPLREDSLADPIFLNTGGGKATFYIFHALPEWLASAILLSVNVRKTFGTGPLGDWRAYDETEKQKATRLRRMEKKAARSVGLNTTHNQDTGTPMADDSSEAIELVEKKENSSVMGRAGSSGKGYRII